MTAATERGREFGLIDGLNRTYAHWLLSRPTIRAFELLTWRGQESPNGGGSDGARGSLGRNTDAAARWLRVLRCRPTARRLSPEHTWVIAPALLGVASGRVV